MKLSEYKLVLTLAIALATVAGATAADNSAASPALNVLSTVTSAELPAKAADLVVQADAKNLQQTTIDVVKAAVGLNPAAAPAIVGSIAQASPTMAATACQTAVALVPDQVLMIARAAAAACPSKAGAIVEAICRVLPADYQKVADAVAEVVPGAGKEILAGISTAIPDLKPVIDQTVTSYNGTVPSVSTVLTQVVQTESTMGMTALTSPTVVSRITPAAAPAPMMPLPQGVGQGAPGVPPSQTPVTPLGSQPTPPIPTRGSHTYSAP